jgi:hypothetical protein
MGYGEGVGAFGWTSSMSEHLVIPTQIAVWDRSGRAQSGERRPGTPRRLEWALGHGSYGAGSRSRAVMMAVARNRPYRLVDQRRWRTMSS